MSQIVSKFYLITIGDKPVYVGVTNREINARFTEHKHDKGLPRNAKIKEIGRVTHDFTWDIEKVIQNAEEVSNQEKLFVEQYDTQDSEYQKAMGGGGTWNQIKHFVANNQTNYFWHNMPESLVLETIEEISAKKVRLGIVIDHTKVSRILENVVSHTDNIQRLRSAVARVKNSQRLESMIGHTRNNVRLKNVVNHTSLSRRLANVIYDTKREENNGLDCDKNGRHYKGL